jgi:hypothetical protein
VAINAADDIEQLMEASASEAPGLSFANQVASTKALK